MSDEIDNGKKPTLSPSQVGALENQGKKLTGNKKENWVDGRTICTTCTYATILRRYQTNTRVVKCSMLNEWVPEDIKECSDYANLTTLTIGQMAGIATLIGGIPERKVGFHKEDMQCQG